MQWPVAPLEPGLRLVPGTGKFDLNGRSLEDYFPNKVHQQLIKAPLVTVDRVESFDIFALLHGGGPSGQAGAVRHGIARALVEINPDFRVMLKRQGFLTRDAREVERKKVGRRKARRGPTFRETLLMHSIGRIAYHGHIDNIQASWVKLGPEGVEQALRAGVNVHACVSPSVCVQEVSR